MYINNYLLVPLYVTGQAIIAVRSLVVNFVVRGVHVSLLEGTLPTTGQADIYHMCSHACIHVHKVAV